MIDELKFLREKYNDRIAKTYFRVEKNIIVGNVFHREKNGIDIISLMDEKEKKEKKKKINYLSFEEIIYSIWSAN